MPIPTSSMYQNVAGQNSRRQQARQLWAEFRLYAMKARKGMVDRRTMALQELAREWQAKPGRSQKERMQQKENLMKLHEKQHFLEMREEWQRMLHSNGLQHEDWGEVTPAEMALIRQVLGPDDIEEEEEEEEEEQILVAHTGGSHNYHPPFVPVNIAAQPISQSVSRQSQTSLSSQSSYSSNPHSYAAPSLPSRSQNSSSASYAVVDPSKFTDDERDDFPIMSSFSGRRGANYAVNSESESNGVPIPTYKTWAPSSQQKSSGFATHHDSNPTSLSSSPIDAPMSRSFHQPSSLSSTSHFPHVPSSLSKSVAVDGNVDRIFSYAVNGVPSSSAAAAASKSKSKLGSTYIGPQVTTNDSENEADADFATMSRADQMAAYENFKRDARIQKIREFHEEAAKLDVDLADKINANSDKMWIARLIGQHEHDMLKLRTEKEEERRRLVHDERSRMTAEIKKGRTSSPTAGPAGTKKGWTVSSRTPATATKTSPKRSAIHSIPTTSSPFTTSNKMSVAPAPKPRTPLSTSSPMGTGFMNLDELQNVLEYAPEMSLDAALQITQLIGSDGSAGAFDHNQEYDQDWDTPQAHHKPNTNFTSATAPRNRKDSVSVLDESRFGTISAKGKQRRDTITVSTAMAGNEPNGANGYWKPQPPSPEESEAMTDQFAKILLSAGGAGAPPVRNSASRAAMRKADYDDDFFDSRGSKPTPVVQATKSTLTNGNAPQVGAWTKKPAQSTGPSPPAATTASGWGATVKKTFGSWGGWNQEGQNSNDDVEAEEEQEQGEDDLVQPSPFSGSVSSKRGPSLLSVTKGRNGVAGAAGAALGPMNGAPSPMPSSLATNRPRKNSASMSAVSTPPPAPLATTTSAATKKAGKKGRQATNKKATPVSLMEQEEEDEQESQPQMTTPKAAASTTKFTSAWGSQNHSTSAFDIGSSSPRHTTSSGGGWDDISATPKPGGLSNMVGGVGAAGGMRRPSGLHNQVWNAEDEEQEEEREEQEEEEYEDEQVYEYQEDEREVEENMPGSLSARGVFGGGAGAGRSGFGLSTTSAKASAKKSPTQSTSAWGTVGSSNTIKQASTTAMNSKKASAAAAARKHQVTMEEIPDESERPDRSPSKFLAFDSHSILEPKPSKPSTMFDDIIQFGAEPGSSPEDTRQRPLTGKQKTSPPAKVKPDATNIDPAILQRAAMQMRRGEERFGAANSGANPSAVKTKQNGINTSNGGPRSKPNGAWGSPSNAAGFMSESLDEPSPFADSPALASKTGFGFGAQKQTSDPAWGSSSSSSPNVNNGIGFGKDKPNIGTSGGGFGTGGFGWGSGLTSIFGGANPENNLSGANQMEGNQFEEEGNEEHVEREREVIDSRRRLKDLFGDSTASGAKPAVKTAAGSPKTPAARAKVLREQREREETERLEREMQEEREAQEQEEREAQEQEEREAQEREEREAQEKAAKEKEEKEEKEREAAPVLKPTGVKNSAKKGKGKRKP